jgi:hypothetical protein
MSFAASLIATSISSIVIGIVVISVSLDVQEQKERLDETQAEVQLLQGKVRALGVLNGKR